MAFTDIFKELSKNNVEYIIAGGYAVALHGVPRMTFDLDFLININTSNLERFSKTMNSYGYKTKVPISIYDLTDEYKLKKLIEEKNIKAINFISPINPEVDLLFDIPVKYEEAIKKCEYKKLQNLLLPVMSIDDLILCKKTAARPQDLEDVKALELIKYRRWKDG